MDVSIVIISYNYANYILECIESCLNQEKCNVNYEIIVVDDGSTDNTQEILKNINYKNLKKITIKNSGIEEASNTGFQTSVGKYIVRVDADDLLLPNYLKIVSKSFDVKYDFFYSNYHIINSKGLTTKKVNLPKFNEKEIFERGDFLATGTMYKSNILKVHGYYNSDKKNSGLENYEFILKLITMGSIGYRIPFNLFAYRRHSGNISTMKRDDIIKNGKDMFFKNKYGEFSSNMNHPYNLRL